MERQGGYLAAKALKNEGVQCIFTLCGGHIQPIYTGCAEVGIKIVDVRHEQAATHAADGWARVTRTPGVAAVTAGPGLTNSITGIANAMRVGVPIVVIGGQAPLFQFEKGALQEMDHVELLRPITKWAVRVHHTSRIPEYIGAAFRKAVSGRPGPVFLEIPVDVLLSSKDDHSVFFPSGSRASSPAYGDPAGVERAAELLRQSGKPVIMAGTGVWWDDAGASVERLSALINAPVYVNGMARGCVNSDNPMHLSQSRSKALAEGDVIVFAGAEFDFRLAFGDTSHINGRAKLIRIHGEPAELDRNRTAEVGIAGNTKAVLEQICDAFGRPETSADRAEWAQELAENEKAEIDSMRHHMESDAVPIHPARLCKEIDDFLGRDAIIIADGGDIVSVGARIIRPRAPGHWLDPGPFGCLGVGAPFGLAAKIANPDKQVLMLYGDGSFGFNGMEMDTAVRFGLPIVAVIGNDGGWGQMRQGIEAAGLGEAGLVATDLGFTRYDKIVEALGGHGEHVESPAEIRPALERSFESRKPACVNVIIDQRGARQLLTAARGMSA